jgi:hypothetical protein
MTRNSLGATTRCVGPSSDCDGWLSSHSLYNGARTSNGVHTFNPLDVDRANNESQWTNSALLRPAAATGRLTDLLAKVEKWFGFVPDTAKAMPNRPAVLNSYLTLSGAVAEGSLSAEPASAWPSRPHT